MDTVKLFKCDRKSRNDASVRTATFTRCLGDKRRFDYETLSRLRFSLLNFTGFSFVGADFSDCTFQSCEFANCDFNAARLAGSRFYECSSDEQTADVLEGLGIQRGTVQRRILRASTVAIENDDPVRRLTERFFTRFIRKELGTHQRTVAKHSMFSGLGGEERRFTERELIPEMKRNGVIQDAGRPGVELYEFNSEWQADGDAIIAHASGEIPITQRVQKIISTLRTKAERYNLV